jgi:arylsulfatase
MAQEPTNFLVILCDDLGYSDLGCYGSEIDTPQLDAIAASGRRYSQFYNTARCWPTRGALLSGYYAQQIRRDTVAGVKSGGQGQRPSWAKLISERLAPHGYHSYHSGKWHVDGLPTKNGFEKSYSLQDHDRHFAPKNHTLDDKPLPEIKNCEDYYSSAYIASMAIDQLKYHQATHPGKPFFSYVAFTAPHFPLQAPKELVEKYQARYRVGWERIRRERWAKMQSLGLGSSIQEPSLIEPDVGPPYHFPNALEKLGPGEVNRPVPWNSLEELQREFQANKMAVHAAMIDSMDTQIGRIFDLIKQDPAQWKNTLVMFLSDNGASAEIMVRGDGHNPQSSPGAGDSYLCLGPGWSSVSNTPFRRHKTWVHEGGIATPMIVHWPARIEAAREPIASPGHVVDIAPTLLEIAATKKTANEAFWSGPNHPGQSLAPHWTQQSKPGETSEDRILWWQHEANRALRQGDWKIVAAGKEAPWELYNLANDRSETINLALDRPEVLERLVGIWDQWTERFRVQATAVEGPDAK